MPDKIKNKIESELRNYIRLLEEAYPLKRISPLLFGSIKEFALRAGKRIRPCLFVIGYLGFSDKAPRGLYRSALSLELLHDFMLVHDDIIDKSDTRRGRPSMHALLDNSLADCRNIKFSGQDLAIVVGDVLYALALEAFLSVNEEPQRKERALKRLIQAALYTGGGEFAELLLGARPIEKIKKADIYKVYGLKTANYTFASPLTIGAALAGADKGQLNILFEYGSYAGRAFQIRDDIIGMFNAEAETGKSNLSDLREAKKTLLVWHAYNHAPEKSKAVIRRILSRGDADESSLEKMRRIVTEAGSLDYARGEIIKCLRKAEKIISFSRMKAGYKNLLLRYSQKILEPLNCQRR